jgi:hypothetical protein
MTVKQLDELAALQVSLARIIIWAMTQDEDKMEKVQHAGEMAWERIKGEE